ncbi:3'(2'),5'-bisphosphate nucleotidase CysQ [Desulfovibrionales bacterium]
MPLLDLLSHLVTVAWTAGRLLTQAQNDHFWIEHKADGSPVTLADRAADTQIRYLLGVLCPGIPIISEEVGPVALALRHTWSDFLLVDPLDGTNEFINRNGEYTVNIALVQGIRPALGIICVPAVNTIYCGGPSIGAWKRHAGTVEPWQPLRTRPTRRPTDTIMLHSRSHITPKLDAFLAGRPEMPRLAMGSALKFCLLTEGVAQLYPCLHPTWEWDTAAGQAILEGAGGFLAGLDGQPLHYNKDSLLNPPFVAWA